MSNLHEKNGATTALTEQISECLAGKDFPDILAALSIVAGSLLLTAFDFDKEQAKDGVDLFANCTKEVIDASMDERGTVQ